jgi:AGZA family xanthine/uracil permease-like MFS transporter
VILNVIVLTTLVLFVVELPADDIVFGRILPALGIALPIGNLYYAFLARRLSQREGRGDVTAMPYGPSVPHMFIVVFVIMLPTAIKSGPVAAWQAGLAWAFIIGVVVIIGAFVGPTIRRYTPTAAMLGTLAGISLTFISMRPAFQMWEVPWVAFITLAIILVAWTASVPLPFGLPAGLVAVIIATIVAWVATALGVTGVLEASAVSDSFDQFGLHLPMVSNDVFLGLEDIGPLLATAIPLGIYNFTEGMSNVESAARAGDEYGLRPILLADGAGAVVGSVLGSPFPPAVYIGHPGWKAVGGRIGYSLATGVVVALICFLGLVSTLIAIFPIQALVPILLFIGLVIGAQAFQSTPARHAPAVVLAILPNLAAWAKSLVDNALNAAGSNAAEANLDERGAGDIYQGMALFGGGAVLAGLVLGSIASFVIDRQFVRAVVASLLGGVLSFIGLIHGEKVELNAAGALTIGYLIMAAIFGAFALLERGKAASATDADIAGPAGDVPAADAVPSATLASGEDLLFVNGTLMRGLGLHHNLDGAQFVAAVRTAPRYRLYSIGDVHPGMHEVDEGGVAVEGELYRVPEDVWRRVEADEPEHLYRGPIQLEDGRIVPGILYPREQIRPEHRDISAHGSWRGYIEERDGPHRGSPGHPTS